MVPMNRQLNLGREDSPQMQPQISPKNFDDQEQDSDAVTFNRPIEGGLPLTFAAHPEINPETFDDEVEMEPTTFNRRIHGGIPLTFDYHPEINPVNHYVEMEINPQSHDVNLEMAPVSHNIQLEIEPLTHESPMQIDPLSHIIPVVINPVTFDMDALEDLMDPVAFNRPLEFAPMTHHRREIPGTLPVFYNRAIPFGAPQTFNIIPDDEDVSTISPGTTDTPIITPPAITTATDDGWSPYY